MVISIVVYPTCPREGGKLPACRAFIHLLKLLKYLPALHEVEAYRFAPK